MTHSTIHTNLKPYACANCKRTFSCIGNLIKHRKVRPDTCGREEFKIQKVNKRARVKVDKNVATVTIPQDEIIIGDQIVYQEVIAYDGNHQIKLENNFAIIIPNEQIGNIEKRIIDVTEDNVQLVQENGQLTNNAQLYENEFVEQNSIEEDQNDEQFTDQEHLNNSIENEELSQYLEINDQSYGCKLCPKIYHKKIISIKHLKKEHNILIKSFNYDDKNRYRKTQRDQSFLCIYCPKKFTSEKMMIRHQIVHGPYGNLIHKCSCCSMWFENLTELENHQSTAHEDRLKCCKCSKKFDQPEKLLSHKKYAHSEKNAVTTKKKYVFVCTLCGRSCLTQLLFHIDLNAVDRRNKFINECNLLFQINL